MNEIWAGIQEAFWLIIILDSDLIEITVRSLKVSFTALVVASAWLFHLALGLLFVDFAIVVSQLQRSTR